MGKGRRWLRRSRRGCDGSGRVGACGRVDRRGDSARGSRRRKTRAGKARHHRRDVLACTRQERGTPGRRPWERSRQSRNELQSEGEEENCVDAPARFDPDDCGEMLVVHPDWQIHKELSEKARPSSIQYHPNVTGPMVVHKKRPMVAPPQLSA